MSTRSFIPSVLFALFTHGCRPATTDTAMGDAGGGYTPGYPFSTYDGHVVTDTPDGHADRTTHRNWDLNCQLGDPVGAMIAGVVTEAQDYVDEGYGNRVCVYSSFWDLEFCHNHFDAGSLTVSIGDEVELGDHIGACGNSGYVIAFPGGDGSHLDAYAVTGAGENYELPHPSTWAPLASLDEPGVSTLCQGSISEVTAEGAFLSVSGEVSCEAGIEKWSLVEGESNILTADYPDDASSVFFAEVVSLSEASLETSAGVYTVGLWARPIGDDEGQLLDSADFAWEAETADCDEYTITLCEDGDVYSYNDCGERGPLVDRCGDSSGCDQTSRTTAECAFEAIDHTITPTSCGSDDQDVFTALDVTLDDASSNPTLRVRWEKCDGSEVSASKDCHVRVGSYEAHGAVRDSFELDAGTRTWTTTFEAWPDASTFAEDICGTTKDLYLTCDEGDSEAHWRGETPVVVEKRCP